MNPIGGYFSLELAGQKQKFLHSEGVCVNSGRNALEYIFFSLPKIAKIYVPYLTCDVILEPILKLKIPYVFYSINDQLEISDRIILGSDEYILVTNYFGIKDQYIQALASQYADRLIVDNAQAYFCPEFTGVKTIYSPRKFVGVPDGGIAVMDDGADIQKYDMDYSYDRCSHLLKRYDLGAEAGYPDFKDNSRKLANQPIRRMSWLTQALLSSVDFDTVKERRIRNFRLLHQALKQRNLLPVPAMEDFACPMVYPFYTNDPTLKKRLIAHRIFVATYWPNVFEWCDADSIEYQLADRIIAIPIDQRYGENEMNSIVELINK